MNKRLIYAGVLIWKKRTQKQSAAIN